MRVRVVSGLAATLFATLLQSGSTPAAEIHLQINPQKSQITATVSDPLARFSETGEIQATLQIVSGSLDDDPGNPGPTG